ncbi:MAG: hypothetical protein JXR84_24550 [Anaerolineae bacterium]|nr:hypothetical protein [Anaerolineae bacterium]
MRVAPRVWYGLLHILIVMLLVSCGPSLSQEPGSLHAAPWEDGVIDDGPLPTRAVTATLTKTLIALPSLTLAPTATATPEPTPTATLTPRPTASPTEMAQLALPTTRTARPTGMPPAASSPHHMAEIEDALLQTALSETLLPETLLSEVPLSTLPTPEPPAFSLVVQSEPGTNDRPTLANFWEGQAEFVLDVVNTGLPMGESDTLVMYNGEMWSYLHSSTVSAGTMDRCGDPVPFPGCTVIYRSVDGGITFSPATPLTCQFECATCPCVSEVDHTEQQQYPRVAYNGATFFLVYEYLGRARLRRSADGLTWSMPERVADTGIWKLWLRTCHKEERIHEHPFVPYDYECLAGGPSGIFVEGGRLYIFVGLGQNPGSMGCYTGSVTTTGEQLTRCQHNPLFVGAEEYGPLEEKGSQTNPYFDFRTISSAEVQRIGSQVYMLYEGVRGPGPGDGGDTQFGLGLARSLTPSIDGPWEKYPGNPILVDQPGNIGLGHADLVVIEGQTFLYTSLNGYTRSRLALVWK